LDWIYIEETRRHSPTPCYTTFKVVIINIQNKLNLAIKDILIYYGKTNICLEESLEINNLLIVSLM
jgi:hypothetical protein